MADSSSAHAGRPQKRKKTKHHAQNASADPQASTSASVNCSSKGKEKAKDSFYDRVNPHKPSGFSQAASNKNAASASSSSGGSQRRKGRAYTLSIALPGSVILNAQSPELRARLVAHVARAAAIFQVDEIVVFREGRRAKEAAALAEAAARPAGGYGKGRYSKGSSAYTEEEDGPEGGFDEDAFMARIMQYLETPQYLRKALFPMHPDLRYAGLLPPLDLPHHLRREDAARYREGVTVSSSSRRKGGSGSAGAATTEWQIDVGLWEPVIAEAPAEAGLAENVRVTVQMPQSEGKHERAKLVSPRTPVQKEGTYWGYSVRLCDSIGAALTATPWSGEAYDLVIGTSERGASLTELLSGSGGGSSGGGGGSAGGSAGKAIPPFKHALLVFGGLSGLEVAIEHDASLQLSADDAHLLFDLWLNVAENQGSRTIRTEEAVLIALARLAPVLQAAGKQ